MEPVWYGDGEKYIFRKYKGPLHITFLSLTIQQKFLSGCLTPTVISANFFLLAAVKFRKEGWGLNSAHIALNLPIWRNRLWEAQWEITFLWFEHPSFSLNYEVMLGKN